MGVHCRQAECLTQDAWVRKAATSRHRLIKINGFLCPEPHAEHSTDVISFNPPTGLVPGNHVVPTGGELRHRKALPVPSLATHTRRAGWQLGPLTPPSSPWVSTKSLRRDYGHAQAHFLLPPDLPAKPQPPALHYTQGPAWLCSPALQLGTPVPAGGPHMGSVSPGDPTMAGLLLTSKDFAL